MNNSGFFLAVSSRSSSFKFSPLHVFGLHTGICLMYSYLACAGLSVPRLALSARPPQFCHMTAGISTCCPSARLSRPRLRSRLTQADSALPGALKIFGRKDSHLPLASSFKHSLFHTIHSSAGTASSRMQCSSTNLFSSSFCSSPAPGHFSAQGPLDQ